MRTHGQARNRPRTQFSDHLVNCVLGEAHASLSRDELKCSNLPVPRRLHEGTESITFPTHPRNIGCSREGGWAVTVCTFWHKHSNRRHGQKRAAKTAEVRMGDRQCRTDDVCGTNNRTPEPLCIWFPDVPSHVRQFLLTKFAIVAPTWLQKRTLRMSGCGFCPCL